jgi:hypothetical protein
VSASVERRASSRDATEAPALARLAADGLIERGAAAGEADGRRRVTRAVGAESPRPWRTSRRFQRAMARAAAALYEAGDPGDDLRVPITLALLEVYEDKLHDEILAELVETMLPIELVSLGLVQTLVVANDKGQFR